MTLHTKEQATQFNFIETVGVGAHYFFKKNLAFSLQGRIRHLSNADIETPNSGIETYSVLVGLTQTF
jgi:predicted porin